MKTLPQLEDDLAARRQDHPALVLQGKAYPYTEFRDRANLSARCLLALGVEKGGRVSKFFLDRRCPLSQPRAWLGRHLRW